MDVSVFQLGPIGTNAYLLHDAGSGEAVLIDAPQGALQLVQEWERREGAKIGKLLLTHGHWDHMLDLKPLRDHGLETYGHPDDREFFENPAVMRAFALPGLSMTGGHIDHWIGPDDGLALLGEQVEIRHVPGHCPGSILFYFPQAGMAFVGDAIFNGGVGRFDIPGGDWPTLERSIRQQIYTLPDDTVLFPGHGPKTRVGFEKANNPFVRADG